MCNGGDKDGVLQDIVKGLKKVLRYCSELKTVDELLRGIWGIPVAPEGESALSSRESI
jgi:hypothetical protein